MLMKITFVSNLFNHHQKYVSDALSLYTNQGYRFIATMDMPDHLKKVGYQEFNRIPYIINAYENKGMKKDAIKEINASDVVVFGSAPDEYIRQYKKQRRILLRYSERPLKKGNETSKYLLRLAKWKLLKNPGQSTFLLCASAFAASDYSKFFLYKNKCYKWGYFPETKKYDIAELISNKDHTKILWVGRFLDWKHPDDALKVAKKLKDAGYSFTMEIVGTGIMEQKLKEMVAALNLTDCVYFPGSVPSDQVRGLMENAGIYLFTSDRYEGWGAVLNESMNSGCAVVASHAIGAVPYLMKHNENGLVYHSGNVDELYAKVKYLLDNPAEQERLGRAAYETITGEWNAEVAAERLITLSEHLLAGEKHPDLYQTGPCSRAEIIKDDWFYE